MRLLLPISTQPSVYSSHLPPFASPALYYQPKCYFQVHLRVAFLCSHSMTHIKTTSTDSFCFTSPDLLKTNPDVSSDGQKRWRRREQPGVFGDRADSITLDGKVQPPPPAGSALPRRRESNAERAACVRPLRYIRELNVLFMSGAKQSSEQYGPFEV